MHQLVENKLQDLEMLAINQKLDRTINNRILNNFRANIVLSQLTKKRVLIINSLYIFTHNV